MKVKIIFFQISILINLVFLSSITEINIHKKLSDKAQFEREFFYGLFNNHKNLDSFLKSQKNNSKFISKHSEKIKKYYSLYQRKMRKFISMQNYENNNGSVPLLNWDDDFYLGFFTIGTPPQLFELFIDTGSNDLWVPSVNCQGCNNVHYYNHSQSSTYVKQGNKFNISYGDNSWAAGYNSFDDVHLAGLTAKNFMFAEITTAYLYENIDENGFYNNPENGLLGLGFTRNSYADPKAEAIIRVLYQQNQVEAPVFSILLSKDRYQNGSRLILGGYNKAYFEGELQYFEFRLLKKFYSIKYGGFNINGTEILPKLAQEDDTFFDSGTTRIYTAIDMWEQINSIVGPINPLCTGIEKLPIINVVIEKQLFPLKPIEYVFKLPAENICTLGILKTVGGGILGDVFMRVYYSVFDLGNNRIGIARAK